MLVLFTLHGNLFTHIIGMSCVIIDIDDCLPSPCEHGACQDLVVNVVFLQLQTL